MEKSVIWRKRVRYVALFLLQSDGSNFSQLQRRRESRATSMARQKLEGERVERLAKLERVIRSVRKLPPKKQRVVTDKLRSVVNAATQVLPETPVSEVNKSGDYLERILSSTDVPTTPEVLTKDSASEGVQEKSVQKLIPQLIDDYQRYRESLPSFAKLQIAVSTIPLTSSDTPSPPQLGLEPDFQVSASRNQYQLALQEGQAWSKLVEDQADAVENAEEEFQDLQEASSSLAESYRKRNEFPTAQIYEDSKTLLSAMGIPCVQSEVPYEGEGLASAIVLAGYGDFVVSEDTVSHHKLVRKLPDILPGCGCLRSTSLAGRDG